MEPIAISINDTAKVLGVGRSSVYALINLADWMPSRSADEPC
jgi:plasmid maintenance system antidote protein VapI